MRNLACLQRDTDPQFLAHVCCGQTAEWIKMPLGVEVSLSPGHIALDGNPASLPKKREHSSHQFTVHVLWGQTAEWINMPLGVEVSLGTGFIVLHGTQLPHKGA